MNKTNRTYGAIRKRIRSIKGRFSPGDVRGMSSHQAAVNCWRMAQDGLLRRIRKSRRKHGVGIVPPVYESLGTKPDGRENERRKEKVE